MDKSSSRVLLARIVVHSSFGSIDRALT